jgi:hypothetical protein
MSNDKKTLYERLGGYDAITAVANENSPILTPGVANAPGSSPTVAGHGRSRCPRGDERVADAARGSSRSTAAGPAA